MESLSIVNGDLVFVHISPGFDLKGVGVDLPGPKPFRTPKLNTLGVCRGDVSQDLKELLSFGAVFNTESDIGDRKTSHWRLAEQRVRMEYVSRFTLRALSGDSSEK